MNVFPLQNANASVISVTGTAAYILPLINTAGAVTHTFPPGLDALDITPENGDIRIVIDPSTAAVSPTASKGFLIKQGATLMLRHSSLSYIKAIATSGTVSCSLQVGESEPGETTVISGGGGAITSIVPGTGATNLGKTEDSAHASGDTGAMVLFVRQNTATALAANGAYIPGIVDTNGNLWVTLGTKISGEDQANDVMKVEQQFTNTHISTATTTTIKSGAGFLKSITITEAVASTIIVYDNTAGSGTIIASFVASAAVQTYELNALFSTGLTIVTAGASKLSVASR